MQYEILINQGAKRQLKKLSAQVLEQLGSAIDKLGQDPRPSGVKKLKGASNFYRVRSGDYRIIYQIQDQQLIVLIVSVGHRQEIYKELG
jgi:mRNA interferase RelE/StbE